MTPDNQQTLAEYTRIRNQLHGLLAAATPELLRQRSDGTRWTNEQLLFHMVFGFMVVKALVPLVHLASKMPRPIGNGFASLLQAGTVPFDFVNYWGSRVACSYFNRNRMVAKLDKTLGSLSRSLQKTPPDRLTRGMAFPAKWDPFFKPYMTLAEVYAYPTKHFDFHCEQLSLGSAAA